ncbi:MAG TPA: tetratricopeptide repeat protein [Acidisarcina sp.]
MTSPPSKALIDLAELSSSSKRSAAEELYFRALDLIASGESGEASRLLRECVAIDPHFADALHGLTRALQDAGELDEAIHVACRLIALEPDDVLAHTRLSILYQAKGMVPEAEAESTRAKLLGWKQQLREGASR